MKCRHCHTEVKLPFVDLGMTPPSNAYLTEQTINLPEKRFPLRVLVCEKCCLAQTEDFTDASELFNREYAYFSSYSSSWLTHCKQYAIDVIERFKLNSTHHVVEVAANDGYLLQYIQDHHIPCTGIEPTANTARVARGKGIPIIEDFFCEELAKQLVKQNKQADLIIANNVLAHVPDINDFVSGFSRLLKPDGVATFEFPHLLELVQKKQFDTIYHEHFSYLSLTVVCNIFSSHGLNIFDVEAFPTHGGSLQVFAQRKDTGKRNICSRVQQQLEKEKKLGMFSKHFYSDFQPKINKIKEELIHFLHKAKEKGQMVVGYGAAAKGNTLINYAAIKKDLIAYIVDRNPEKQKKFTPGSHIPIFDEKRLQQTKPNYILILPWNLKTEIMQQLHYVHAWRGKFVIAIPELEMIP